MSIRQGDYLIAGAGGGGAGDIDNKSITNNASNKIQTVGVIDQNNTTNAIKSWSGTKLQYDALVNAGTIDNNTLYYITDDNGSTNQPDRNIGEIVTSTIPLTDAGLHLLDGALISGSGSYSAFVDYMADLYNTDPTANFFAQADGLPWTQPILTANGTMGGDSFAVSASSEFDSNYQAYMAFDNSSSSQWASSGSSTPCYIEFYNPIPLRVTELTITNRNDNETFITGAVYGSNDNNIWIELTTFANSNTTAFGIWSIDLSSNTNFYEYYRINGTSFSGNNNGFANIAITAIQPSSAEEWWQSQVNQYGVCGKFVYDSVNRTVRLPKYSTKIWSGEGNAPGIGNGMTLGLTNGTDNVGLANNTDSLSRTFVTPNNYGISVATSSAGGASPAGGRYGVTTDPTKSGIIVDLSNITTALDGYWYIVIANSKKTDIEVDIDEIATDLNGKIDVDLSNMNPTQTVKNTIVGWGMPDYSAGVELNTTPYTATYKCWASVNLQYSDVILYVNNVIISHNVSSVPTSYNATITQFIPLDVGDVLSFSGATISISAPSLSIYPCKGVN